MIQVCFHLSKYFGFTVVFFADLLIPGFHPLVPADNYNTQKNISFPISFVLAIGSKCVKASFAISDVLPDFLLLVMTNIMYNISYQIQIVNNV